MLTKDQTRRKRLFRIEANWRCKGRETFPDFVKFLRNGGWNYFSVHDTALMMCC